jgi:hypothetical protein
MKSRQEENNPRELDANYNPTARNFDHTDVGGQPDPTGGNTGAEKTRKENEEEGSPVPRLGVEEVSLADESLADKQPNEVPDEPREMNRAQEQDGPVK